MVVFTMMVTFLSIDTSLITSANIRLGVCVSAERCFKVFVEQSKGRVPGIQELGQKGLSGTQGNWSLLGQKNCLLLLRFDISGLCRQLHLKPR
jgi:hypothetical protein